MAPALITYHIFQPYEIPGHCNNVVNVNINNNNSIRNGNISSQRKWVYWHKQWSIYLSIYLSTPRRRLEKENTNRNGRPRQQ